ncbi:MAG: hypothetical protein ABSC04_00095 [Syntrophobacteraceae bacterium]
MNRIISLSIFGIAMAVVVALGVPGTTNALANDNGANASMIQVADLGITIGGGGVGVGVDTNRDMQDRDRAYENERARQRAYDEGREQDRALDRAEDQRREYNRENREGTYDRN